MDPMEKAFEKLKVEGVNSVDNLVKWIKDSKIIDESKEAEQRARRLFDEVKDKNHVEFAKFKQVITKLAADSEKSVDQTVKMLEASIPKLQEAFAAAARAFQEAWNKK